jgi:hypothetical protein
MTEHTGVGALFIVRVRFGAHWPQLIGQRQGKTAIVVRAGTGDQKP